MKPRQLLISFSLTLIMALSASCVAPARKPAVPPEVQGQAVVPGFDQVRYRVGNDGDLELMAREGVDSFKREKAYQASIGGSEVLPPSEFLAISGGGDNGAFAAGLLNGWSKRGDRPQFKLVTGISTGALIAPFAFLGSNYDKYLTELYTGVTPDDIMERRDLLTALTSDAMADNRPLRRLVNRYITPEMLKAVAAEYAKGRVLLVGTADLDAMQGVIWNMTRIAATGGEEALDLFRNIMIASAAIPGAFPPMMINVKVGDEDYQEMHVDGGAITQVFIYPPSLGLKKLNDDEITRRAKKLYIIRNSRLDPEWGHTERRVLTIAQRAIASLIQTQGLGDLYKIYLASQRDGLEYNLAYIPATFTEPHEVDFDQHYMTQLYRLGYEMAVKGYPWLHHPPGYLEQ